MAENLEGDISTDSDYNPSQKRVKRRLFSRTSKKVAVELEEKVSFY